MLYNSYIIVKTGTVIGFKARNPFNTYNLMLLIFFWKISALVVFGPFPCREETN